MKRFVSGGKANRLRCCPNLRKLLTVVKEFRDLFIFLLIRVHLVLLGFSHDQVISTIFRVFISEAVLGM